MVDVRDGAINGTGLWSILSPIGVPVQRLMKVEGSKNTCVANDKKSLEIVYHGWRIGENFGIDLSEVAKTHFKFIDHSWRKC